MFRDVVYRMQEAGLHGMLQLLLALFTGLWGLVVGGLYAARKRVPAVVAVAPLGLHPLLAVGGYFWAMSQVEQAVATVASADRLVLMSQGRAETLGILFFSAAAVPGAFLLLLGAGIGGLRAPRKLSRGGLALVAMAPLVIAPLVSVFLGTGVFTAIAQMVFVGLSALLVAAAFSGDDLSSSHFDGAVSAAVAAGSVVVAWAVATTASDSAQGLKAIAAVSAADKASLVAEAMTALKAVPLHYGESLFALLVAGFAVARGAARAGTGRVVAAALACVVLFCWAGALVAADGRNALHTGLDGLLTGTGSTDEDPGD
jgi:hypothetical protein